MNKLLSCRYNMDTNRVEARFTDGSAVAIECIAVEDEYGNPRHSGQNWTGYYTTSPWSTPSLCWVVKSSIISHSAETTAD